MKGDIRRESETLSFCAVLHFLLTLRYSSSSNHFFSISECHHVKDIAAQTDVGGARICSLHPFPVRQS